MQQQNRSTQLCFPFLPLSLATNSLGYDGSHCRFQPRNQAGGTLATQQMYGDVHAFGFRKGRILSANQTDLDRRTPAPATHLRAKVRPQLSMFTTDKHTVSK